MRRKSQKDEIHEFMRAGYEITPIEAIRHFGCFRLAARIAELRREGAPIADRWIPTLDGRGRYKGYRLDAS